MCENFETLTSGVGRISVKGGMVAYFWKPHIGYLSFPNIDWSRTILNQQ